MEKRRKRQVLDVPSGTLFVFIWVPGYVGIRGNETADRAAKEAFDKEPTDNLMPF